MDSIGIIDQAHVCVKRNNRTHCSVFSMPILSGALRPPSECKGPYRANGQTRVASVHGPFLSPGA